VYNPARSILPHHRIGLPHRGLCNRLSAAKTPHRSVSVFSLWKRTLLWGLTGIVLFGLVAEAAGQVPDSSALRERAEARAAAGDSLRGARQWSEARAAYRRARALYRRSGDAAAAAGMTGSVGIAYYLDEQLDAARSAFQRAAAEAKEAGNRAEAASNLNNVGLVEWRRGRYDAALTHIREAVQIQRALGNRKQVASGLNNLANIQEERGRYDEALENLRTALDINRAQEDTGDVASNLNNLGLILRSQGRYEDALRRHRRALAYHRTAGTDDGAAAALNNIGVALEAQGAYDRALTQYRKALELSRRLDDQSSIGTNLNNIAAIQAEQGHHDEALSTLRNVLRRNRAAEDRAGVATNLSGIGAVHEKRGAPEAARRFYERALRVNRTLGRREGTASTLHHVGELHLDAGRYSAADSVLRESIRVTETLLQTASGDARRDFLAKEIERFQALVTTQARAGRPTAALRTYERSRARVLAERLAGDADSASTVPPVDSLQAPVGPDEAAVLYANTDTEHPLLAMVVTRDSVRAREVSTGPIQRAARRHEEALDRLRVKEQMPWIRQRASLLEEAKGVEGELANLVRLYRHDVSVPPREQLLSPERRRRLGQVLYTVLIDPIEPTLVDADGLVVVPDGALSYLPFEALSDWDRTRLVERWRVRYAQSLRVLHLLGRRSRSVGTDRRPLLALGGIVYDSLGIDAARERDRRTGGLRTEPERATATTGRDVTADAGSTSVYRRLGYGPERWQNIPGTLREARALRRIAGEARLLTGARASERSLQQLSADGTLDDYRALHFATHGLLVPNEPSLSALVLAEVGGSASQAQDLQEREPGRVAPDGYLSMREIVRLDLNAEFVGLSACRTGLGRIYRGSGAVSLAQAFLQAGAGSVAVSLWSVYDASTSRFMEVLYRQAWRDDISWAEAMAQTKRAFAEGDHGRRLQAPRFWAPFVHYGRDAGRSRPGR